VASQENYTIKKNIYIEFELILFNIKNIKEEIKKKLNLIINLPFMLFLISKKKKSLLILFQFIILVFNSLLIYTLL